MFWILYFKRKYTVPENKWILSGIVLAGICGFLAVELGWITTEEGRQPWIIYNLMRVSQAVTPNPWMTVSFFIFTCIYILLGVVLVVFLVLLRRRKKPEEDSWSDLLIAEKGETGIHKESVK